MSDRHSAGALSGRRIALPESRELDRLARMLEEFGAQTLRCPMVAIADAPDPGPVRDWLMRLPFDDLVLFTGEGLRRLHGLAQRSGLEAGFLNGLQASRRVTRGPKPERALRELGLSSDLRAEQPTTEGLISTLSAQNLRSRRVGVQLYPGNPNTRFTNFLRQSGAEPDTVLPYVYAAAAADEKVVALIESMAGGEVDVTLLPALLRSSASTRSRRRPARKPLCARLCKQPRSLRSAQWLLGNCGGVGCQSRSPRTTRIL